MAKATTARNMEGYGIKLVRREYSASNGWPNTENCQKITKFTVSAKSEDDAFERLLRLSLKGTQEREIIHILITMLLKVSEYDTT